MFCLSFSFINLSSILVFALPPSLSLLFNDKNTIEIKVRGGRRPFFHSYPFSMVGESERGWLLARGPPPCFSISLLSPYLFGYYRCSQTEKESEFLSFSWFFLWLFYFTGKRTRENKDKRGKMKTSTIFSWPWAMERVSLWIVFLHLQARKKDAPETKNNNVSLCLYPCRYLSFFRSFFSFRSFPVPTSISHSLILSLSVSQSLYLTLCAMEAGACCTLPEKRHPCDLSSLTSFSLLSIYYLLTD